jgi:hypothetical protein
MNIRSASALSCGLLLALASCGSSKAVTTAAPAAAPAVTNAAPAATTAAPATALAPSTALAPATAAPDPGAVTTQPAAVPAAAVPEIYKFKTNKVGGGAVDGAEFAGKPTAFWFWAPT